MKKLFLMSLVAVLAQSPVTHASLGDGNGQSESLKKHILLYNISSNELCSVGDSNNSKVRACTQADNVLASELAANSTNAKTAGGVIAYYLVCSAINVGSVALAREAMKPDPRPGDHFPQAGNVMAAVLAIYGGGTFSIIPCLPVSGINYALYYVYEKSQGRSGSWDSLGDRIFGRQ